MVLAKSACNGGDFECGETAAIALGLVVALAPLELEGDALFAAVLIDDLCGDRSAINGGGANFERFTFADHEGIEFHFGIDIGIKLLDVETSSFLNAVLLTAGFDHCVGHGRGEIGVG